MIRRLKWLFRDARNMTLTRVFGLVVSFALIGSLLALQMEHGHPRANIKTFPDALWWSIVTLATVGYGDHFPVTTGGRLVALFLMLFGVGALSIFTASIASIFVEKRMRERMGIESFKWQNHHILCGWSPKVQQILANLEGEADRTQHLYQVLLVHEGAPDTVTAMLPNYPHLRLNFVRGDYTSEATMRRANVQEAKTIAFLADDQHVDSSDERNIIAAQLALHLNNNLDVCAELRDARYRNHLERLEVDNIIVVGEHDGYILSNAILSAGVPNAFQQLLGKDSANAMQEVRIPAQFTGQTFAHLSTHFREKGAMLIGIGRSQAGLSLDDLTTGGNSFIDQFIRRKFQEAERGYFSNKGSIGVMLNPPLEEPIQANDTAIIIGRV